MSSRISVLALGRTRQQYNKMSPPSTTSESLCAKYLTGCRRNGTPNVNVRVLERAKPKPKQKKQNLQNDNILRASHRRFKICKQRMDGDCAKALTMSKDRHRDTTKDTIAQHVMSLRFIQGVLYHWQRQAVANGLVPHTALRDLRSHTLFYPFGG